MKPSLKCALEVHQQPFELDVYIGNSKIDTRRSCKRKGMISTRVKYYLREKVFDKKKRKITRQLPDDLSEAFI